MKHRFNSKQKAILSVDVPNEQNKPQPIRRGLIPPLGQVDYLARRLFSSVFLMPFYANSQSSSVGGVIDDHVYEPATVPGFASQPRSLQDGDILLLQVETDAAQTVATPTGWELCPNLPISSGDTKLTMFWKRLSGIGSTTTVVNSGEHHISVLFVIRGCVETGNPFDVSATNTGSGTTITFPSVTSTTDKGLVVLATTFDRSGANAEDLSAGTNANFSYIWREAGFAQEDTYATYYSGGLGFFSAGFPTKGITGTTTTIQATSTDWTSYTAVLKPCVTKRPYIINASNFSVAQYRALENDIIIAFIETNNEAVTVATPSGFTAMDGSPIINAGTNPTRLTMYWKRAGASGETYPTFTGHSNHIRSFVVLVRGCITTGNPFEASYSTNTGTGTAVSVGGITTTVDNCYVFTLLATTRDASSFFTTFNTWTNASLDNFVAQIDSTTPVGTGGGVAMAGGWKATAGAVNGTTVTQSTSVEWCAWQGALKPAV